jgi:hypothetical protein
VSRRWTVDDERLLRSLYEADEPIRVIAVRLDRSEDAIEAHRRVIGVQHRSRPMRTWTPSEDAFLVAATEAQVPASEIGRRLGRTADAVRRRREICGITRPPHRPYTALDDERLRIGVRSGASFGELAVRLGRTPGAVRLRAKTLGLIESTPRRRWRGDEDDLLRFGYRSGWPAGEIHARLLRERTVTAICARARILGLAVYGRRWTAAEDRRLRDLVGKGLSVNLIAAELHRTREAVAARCRANGFARPPLVAGTTGRNHRRWTEREDEWLRSSTDVDTQTLARRLGRSEAAVRRRRKVLLAVGTTRTQHHPGLGGAVSVTPAQVQQVARAMPVTATRLIALSKRLQLPFGTIQSVVRQIEASGVAASGR